MFSAPEVVVSDGNPARLDLARELRATEVVDGRERSLGSLERAARAVARVLRASPSGHPHPAIADGIRAVAPAGRAVLVGMGGDEVPLPLTVVQERELEVTGTFRYGTPARPAVALVIAGRLDLDRLVTGTNGFDDPAGALTASRRDPTAVKAVVRPQT